MSNPIVLVLMNLLTNPIVLGAIIFFIVCLVKSGKKKPAEPAHADIVDAAEPEIQPETKTETVVSTYSGGPAKIFVNGGLPASGNVMGTLYVDGKRLELKYTDAPIEISVASGKHHIVIEGGHYGDARVDRTVDFGVTDVLTVDMPGGDDADVIRHQMVSYSEYSRAVRDCGFTVTRKSL